MLRNKRLSVNESYWGLHTWIMRKIHRIQWSCQQWANPAARWQFLQRRRLFLWLYGVERKSVRFSPRQWHIQDQLWRESASKTMTCSSIYREYSLISWRTFPIASKPLSKSSNMPRNKNDMPKPAKPMPISAKKQWFSNGLNLTLTL